MTRGSGLTGNSREQNDFELLQLEPSFDITKEQLEERQRDLSKVLHPDRFVSAPPGQRRAALGQAIAVNDAVRRLKDPVYRGNLLLSCKFGAPDDAPMAAPELLMEVMELREQLAAARSQGSGAEVDRLSQKVYMRRGQLLTELSDRFERLAQLDSQQRGALIEALRTKLGELRYLERFVEEVDRVLDDVS